MPTDLGSSSSAYRSADLEGADPGADQKRRARWRLLGATIFSLAVATAAYQLMLQEPRPLAQDFVVLMPVGDGPVVARAVTSLREERRETNQEADDNAERGVTSEPSESLRDTSASKPSRESATPGLKAERVESPVVVAVTPAASSSTANGAESKSSARVPNASSGAGASKAWFVQLGAYDSQEGAAAMAAKVRGLGYSATVQGLPSAQGTLYRVRVGPFSESQAKAYLERVRAQGYASFLVRP